MPKPQSLWVLDIWLWVWADEKVANHNYREKLLLKTLEAEA